MLVTEKCGQVNMNLFCSFILLICLVLQSNHVNDYHSACMITGGIFIYTDGISKSFDGQKNKGGEAVYNITFGHTILGHHAIDLFTFKGGRN